MRKEVLFYYGMVLWIVAGLMFWAAGKGYGEFVTFLDGSTMTATGKAVLPPELAAATSTPAAFQTPGASDWGVLARESSLSIITHTVSSGETIESLARTYEIPETLIKAANGVSGTEPIVGQELNIPKLPPPRPPPASGGGLCEESYRICPEESNYGYYFLLLLSPTDELYDAPGPTGEVVGTLERFLFVQVLDKSIIENWWLVELDDGRVGWIHGLLFDSALGIVQDPVSRPIVKKPLPTATPIPVAVDIMHTGRVESGRSGFVGIGLNQTSQAFKGLFDDAGGIARRDSLDTVAGATPQVRLNNAFGPVYKGCVEAILEGTAFEIGEVTLGCQPVEQEEILWMWSITPKGNTFGDQTLLARIQAKWKPVDPNQDEIWRELWRGDLRVQVVRTPLGYIELWGLVPALLGSLLSAPWLWERWKELRAWRMKKRGVRTEAADSSSLANLEGTDASGKETEAR